MLNKGISFGFLPGISNVLIALVLIGLIVYAVKVRELIVRLSLGLMVIGGSGNLYVIKDILCDIVDNHF